MNLGLRPLRRSRIHKLGSAPRFTIFFSMETGFVPRETGFVPPYRVHMQTKTNGKLMKTRRLLHFSPFSPLPPVQSDQRIRSVPNLSEPFRTFPNLKTVSRVRCRGILQSAIVNWTVNPGQGSVNAGIKPENRASQT